MMKVIGRIFVFWIFSSFLGDIFPNLNFYNWCKCSSSLLRMLNTESVRSIEYPQENLNSTEEYDLGPHPQEFKRFSNNTEISYGNLKVGESISIDLPKIYESFFSLASLNLDKTTISVSGSNKVESSNEELSQPSTKENEVTTSFNNIDNEASGNEEVLKKSSNSKLELVEMLKSFQYLKITEEIMRSEIKNLASHLNSDNLDQTMNDINEYIDINMGSSIFSNLNKNKVPLNQSDHPSQEGKKYSKRLLQSFLPPTFADLYIRPGTRVGGQVIPSGRIGGWSFAYDMRGIQPGVVTNYGAWYPLFYPYTTGSSFTYTPPPIQPSVNMPYGRSQQSDILKGLKSTSQNGT